MPEKRPKRVGEEQKITRLGAVEGGFALVASVDGIVLGFVLSKQF